MYSCPITILKIFISSIVASLLSVSLLRSIILAANSVPVSFSMHRLTVELTPLEKKIEINHVHTSQL